MSIAPFLPGLPVPAAPDGTTTSDAAGAPGASVGDPGTGGTGGYAFGDALAAALAGAIGVHPAATTAPAPASPPPAGVGVPPTDVGLPTADVGVPPADLAVPLADVGVAAADVGLAAGESGVVARGGPEPTAAAARPTTDRPAALASALLPASAPTGTTLEPALGGRDSTAVATATAGSTGATPNSTAASTDSTAATADSTAATSNSTAGIANSAGATPNSAGPVTKAVVQQVFPEVTRIVSTVGTSGGPGNGTHRITLTLQPEQLGEVRVTLVVRDGAVHVRLAGGEGADGAAVHRALAGEAPELQRILERTGAEARVTVRDPFAPLLPPAAASAATPSGLQTGPDAHARSETQARQDRQDGQAGQAGREQPREQPRRQEPSRAAYPVEPAPVAGRLDRTV